MSYESYSDLIWGALDIDYYALSKRAKKISSILKDAEKVHITTDDGTDLRFSLKGRRIYIDDGIMDEEDMENKAFMQNLPTGEVYCAPIEASAEGTAVFQYNIFRGEPLVNLRTTFKDGRMTDLHGDKGVEFFKNTLDSCSGEKYRIAELGIGLNPMVKEVIGDLALDEKIIGTVHIAIGENRMFEGENEATIHHDLVMKNPTLVVDGTVVMEKGEYRV
jgi:leucyl aminopeptidase (aminopeptidase T)